jgi:Zn-dependent protease with chaperone function
MLVESVDLKTQKTSIEMSLEYQRLKLKIIFAITLLVITGSLILVTSLLSGGSTFIGLLIILIFGIFYVYETTKKFKMLSKAPLLEHSEIIEMIGLLSKNGNIDPPSVLVEDEDVINAYALSTLKKSYIILPRGIIDSFDNGDISKEEMESIIAHELGHIINKDSFISAGMWATVRFFQLLQSSLEKIGSFISKITQKSADATRRADNWLLICMTLLLALLLVLIIVSSISLSIFIFVCVFFIHLLGRQQEHVADLISAKLTQKPNVLATALHNIHKLDLLSTPASQLSPYEYAIVSKSTIDLKDENLTFRDRIKEYSSTHPNLTYRINLLLSPN